MSVKLRLNVGGADRLAAEDEGGFLPTNSPVAAAAATEPGGCGGFCTPVAFGEASGQIMTSSSASSVKSMKSPPPSLAAASGAEVGSFEFFTEDVEGAGASFFAASCAKKEAAEEAALFGVEEEEEAASLPAVLDRLVRAEFLNILGGDARPGAALMPALLAISRSTSDELVAAAFGATVDADRPSPEGDERDIRC